MTKLDFILALHEQISDLPKADVEEQLRFYSEMIEDRMEEGIDEETAVEAVGSVQEIAAQIRADFVPCDTKIASHKRTMQWWEILLLIVGSPVWVSLLIAAAAVVLSLYVSLWAVVVSLWAVFGSVIGCSIAFCAASAVLMITGECLPGFALLGAGLLCAGLAIFMYYGCHAVSKGTVVLTGKVVKILFRKKEAAV